MFFGKCGDPASGCPALSKRSQIANIAPYADSLSCMDDRIGIKFRMPLQVRDRPPLPEMLNPNAFDAVLIDATDPGECCKSITETIPQSRDNGANRHLMWLVASVVPRCRAFSPRIGLHSGS
nr:hypothetical protein [Mesorhizobium waimense]